MNNRIFLAIAMAFGATSIFAQTPALNWTSNGTNPASTTSTRGYSFNVLAADGIDITDLTFFDNGADGLAEAHQVGIWDSAGNLLASTTIAAGTVNALDVNNLFRVQSISPIHLAQGSDYVVGGTFEGGSADLQALSMVGLTTPAEISYGETRFNNNGVSALSFPTSTISLLGLPGGSFQFTTAAVPEPATMFALGLGLTALIRRRRK